jgi:hypothetical protein
MGIDEKEALKQLQTIPNVGPKIAVKLYRLGIEKPAQLARRNPHTLYEKLNAMDGVRHDPCLLDVFCAAVWYAKGKGARDWWEFSRERKAKAQ